MIREAALAEALGVESLKVTGKGSLRDGLKK